MGRLCLRKSLRLAPVVSLLVAGVACRIESVRPPEYDTLPSVAVNDTTAPAADASPLRSDLRPSAAATPMAVDPWQPVVSAMPAHCELSRELIDADPFKPDWCTAAALPLTSEVAQRALSSVLGEHRSKVQSSTLTERGRWRSVDVVDSLKVELLPDGTVDFSVWLNFVNDHTCTLEGTLDVIDETTFRFRSEECAVSASVHDRTLTFTDECPSSCATSFYCGARGSFPQSSIKLDREVRRAK